ncbi:toprim domain-containing protein, partial [Sphingobium sp.]|uniref:toprim domain-containing protein n=1 Tax=Sphingobium sp. TaxID=1912891 RepID=UPI002CFDE075
RALRFHGATPLGGGMDVRFLPAILAAVVEADQIVAVQRIFLQPNGRPALLTKFKRTLGSLGAGAVQIQPAQTVLGLAEGVESAASAGTLLGIPVWATLGAERFDRVAIPQSVKRLVLLADNDRAGRRAVAKAKARYMRPGRRVITLWPPAPYNDWNELHRAGGEVVVERARLAA